MVLVIDGQIAGISGDMLLSSLVNLGANKSKVIDGAHHTENYLKDSKIKKIDFEKIVKYGTEATYLNLEVDESHHERKGLDIQECILLTSDKIGLSDTAKVFAKESVRSLLVAESKIHGEPIESVHFHEASSIDTAIDIIGTAIALDDLGIFSEEITSTPIAVGGGSLSFSHGTVSNPASAILEIFRNSDIIIQGGQVKEELTTPTGASMITNLTTRCSEFYPPMKVRAIGYGAGKKDFNNFPNVLKIVRGESIHQYSADTVQILETNLDDVSGEVIGHAIDRLMSNGAKDVTVTAAITKKNRPSNIISVICDSSSMNNLIDILIAETGTLGIRVRTSDRYVSPRVIVSTPITIRGRNFTVKCKIVKNNDTIKHFKVESDDIKSIADALSVSFREASDLVSAEVKQKIGAR